MLKFAMALFDIREEIVLRYLNAPKAESHLSAESRGDNEKHDAFHEGANQIGAGDTHQQGRANNTEALRHEEHRSSHARLHTKRRAWSLFFKGDDLTQYQPERAGVVVVVETRRESTVT